MTMKKVKEFCEEHKAEIAIGIVSSIAGGFLAEYLLTHPRGSEKILLRHLRAFGDCQIDGRPLVEKVIDVSRGATRVYTGSNIEGVTIKNIGEDLLRVYQEYGWDTETPVTGILVFENANKK